jgi:hypothetical protein
VKKKAKPVGTIYFQGCIRRALDAENHAVLEAIRLKLQGKEFQFVFTSRGDLPYLVNVVQISDTGDADDLQLARNRLEALTDWNYRLTRGQAEALRQDYLAHRKLALPMPVMEDNVPDPTIDDLKRSGIVSRDPNEKKAKPAGSSPALRIACPVCEAPAGTYCTKQGFGNGAVQVIAHKKRRELEERTR